MAEKHVVRGILAGVAGGLAAGWLMNQWSVGPGAKLEEAIETPAEKAQLAAVSDGADATMKTADKLTATVTGGQHLTYAQQSTGGPIVHYAYAAVMGGLYGALAELTPAVTSGFGTSFGGALFVGGDLLAVPALGLSAPLKSYPADSYLSPAISHLVYGATTELVRRVARKLL